MPQVVSRAIGVIGLLTVVACANRGMRAPDGAPPLDDDDPGTAGAAAAGTGGGGAGVGGAIAGRGGAGGVGTTGAGGVGGAAGSTTVGQGGSSGGAGIPGGAGSSAAGRGGSAGAVAGAAGASGGGSGAAGRGGASGGAGTGGQGGGGGAGGVTARGGTSGGGAGGTAGAGAAGRGGAGGTSGGAGVGGASGAAGASGGLGGAAGGIVDGGADGPACATRFNFEAGALHGARLNTGYQTAFTALANGADAACGAGALQIATAVDVTNNKGELIIPFAAAEDVSGKTFSISLKASPAGTPAALAIVFLIPSYAIVTSAIPLPATWTTKTVTLPSGADAGTSMATGISIQLIGRGDVYAGTISVDEIDIR